jgi:hypothetical protein
MTDRHTSELSGTVMGFAGIFAAFGPGPTLALFLLVGGACMLVVGVYEFLRLAAPFLPLFLVVAALAVIWLIHRGFLSRCMPRAASLTLSGVLAVTALLIFEMFTSGIGIAVGRVTGVNPDVTVIRALGIEQTWGLGIRNAIDRDAAARKASTLCADWKASRKLDEGTGDALDKAAYCEGHLTQKQKLDACASYATKGPPWTSNMGFVFCMRSGFNLPRD